MANDLNQCNFIGRLGKDVEVRYAPSGAAVASFSLAVGSSWKDKNNGQKQEKTEWVNVTAFGNLATLCEQYLKKGSKVFITGRMETDKWEKDGVTRYTTKIILSNVQFLDSKNDQQASSAPAQQQAAPANIDDFDDDKLPF